MPGSNARALEKAKTIAADALILDLEDAVAPDAKDTARKQVCDAVKAGGYGQRELVIRINALDTPWGPADLAAAAALVSSLVNAPLPTDAVYFGEISLSGAVRPVAQTSARLKEAAKLGFGRAVLPESARGEVGGDGGLALNSVGGLTSLVAEIAARGNPRNNRDNNREGALEKNATPARFRRENG
jgi:hypothetical protein